jgi:hypothetical protein
VRDELKKVKLTVIAIVIMDFNRAKTLTKSVRDQDLLREEAERLEKLMEMAMSSKDPWQDIPAETRKLLGR